MPLDPSVNFEADIEHKDTSLIPIVKIGDLYVSTNSMTYSGATILPLLTSNPGLKESIDIETRKYKISSVSITINNYPYGGKRFSKLLGGDVINDPVEIYWISPSTTTWSGDVDGALKIYQGQVRRYSHDDKSCKITVEDISQATLHKPLPLANSGTGVDVPDKYKNKPIPMVYGYVDRSPCLFTGTYDAEYDFFQVSRFIIDSLDVNEKIETTITIANKTIIETPLYLADGENTFNCASEGNALDDGTNFISYNNTDPYIDLNLDTSIENSSNLGFAKIRKLREPIKAIPRYRGQGGDGNQSNRFAPPGGNDGSNPTPPESTYIYDSDPSTYWILLKYGQDDENVDDGYNAWIYFSTLDQAKMEAAFITLSFAPLSGDFDLTSQIFASLTIENVTYHGNHLLLVAWVGETVPVYTQSGADFQLDNSAQEEVIGWIYEGSSIDYDTYGDNSNLTGGLDITNILSTFNVPMGALNIGIPFHANLTLSGNKGVAIKDFIIKDLVLFQEGVSDNLNKYDFYANVVGRASDYSGWGIPSAFNPTAPVAIWHIMTYELGHEPPAPDSGEYPDWGYSFTVDKKIDSKKLIENIASASPYIPHFDNMGNFKLDVIPPTAVEASRTIEGVDVIDFSFSRTPIEDVYTKVVFKYNWDYAREEFNDHVTAELTNVDEDVYEFGYYGFADPEWSPVADDVYGGIIHPESTLIIDDDRGKYIRHHNTAQEFASWYLMWSCNQHLKIKVKLPLKYMNVVIGDMVSFDTVLGGIEPYGINYTDLSEVNHQLAFGNFLVTSTNKTLEWVEIKCIQMHNLDLLYEDVPGCTDSDYCEYNELATEDNGTCLTQPEENYDCEGNCLIEEDCAGVCGGDSTCCEGNGWDDCGVCGGTCFDSCVYCDGTNDETCDDCADCAGVPNGGHWESDCGCVAADNSGDDCDDCFGIPYGDALIDDCDDCSSPDDFNSGQDECGVCNGNGIPDGECDCNGNVDLGCGCGNGGMDCDGECPEDGACDCEGNVLDECGVCGGFGIIGNCNCINPEEDCEVCDNISFWVANPLEIPDNLTDLLLEEWAEACDTNNSDNCEWQPHCDCNGSVYDECGVCGGDGTDMAGNWGGTGGCLRLEFFYNWEWNPVYDCDGIDCACDTIWGDGEGQFNNPEAGVIEAWRVRCGDYSTWVLWEDGDDGAIYPSGEGVSGESLCGYSCDCVGGIEDECGVCGGNGSTCGAPEVTIDTEGIAESGATEVIAGNIDLNGADIETLEATWTQTEGTLVDLEWSPLGDGEYMSYVPWGDTSMPSLYWNGDNALENLNRWLMMRFIVPDSPILGFRLDVTTSHSSASATVQILVNLEDAPNFHAKVNSLVSGAFGFEGEQQTLGFSMLEGDLTPAYSEWTLIDCTPLVNATAADCPYDEELNPNGTVDFSINNPNSMDTSFILGGDNDGDGIADQMSEGAEVSLVFRLSAWDSEDTIGMDDVQCDMRSTAYECIVGDMNDDGAYNVLDIVAVANCVLTDSCVAAYDGCINDTGIVGGATGCCPGDVNDDGFHNVLDIVSLANCVLTESCG